MPQSRFAILLKEATASSRALSRNATEHLIPFAELSSSYDLTHRIF